jgi:adenosylhomocysteine nucleosidase
MFKRPAIFYALDLEIRPFRRSVNVLAKSPLGKGEWARCELRGRELCLVRSGVGGRNIGKALEALTGVWKPDLLVLTGFTGACDPQFHAGQVVVPGNIVTADGNTLTAGIDGPQNIPQAAPCTMMTVTKVYQFADKQRLLQAQGPGRVVDMESGFFAAWALEHRIPFLVIKAVSDPYRVVLPSSRFLSKFFEKKDGREMLKQMLRHPLDFYRLKKLHTHCRLAAENLKTALQELLSEQEKIYHRDTEAQRK